MADGIDLVKHNWTKIHSNLSLEGEGENTLDSSVIQISYTALEKDR